MKFIQYFLALLATTSIAHSQNTIIAAEYYIDSDPGEGKGAAISAKDGSFDSISEEVSFDINTSNLSLGRHYVFIRYKDINNGWGETRSVAIDIANPKGIDDYIMEAEFYVDNDPGKSLGTALIATDGTFDSSEEIVSGSINTSALSHGTHTVNVRAKGSRGGWGDTTSITFNVIDTVDPTISSVVMSSNNATIDVVFSEKVYNTANGSGDLEASDFQLLITFGRAKLSSETPTSIAYSNGKYTLGLGLNGIPESTQGISVKPVDDSIYDTVGNEASTDQNNNFAYFNKSNIFSIKKDGSGNFANVQSAIDDSNVKNGDTLIVYPGIFDGNIDFKGKLLTIGSQYVTTKDTLFRDSTVLKGVVTMSSLASAASLEGLMIYQGELNIRGGSPKIDRLHVRESTNGAINIINSAEVTLSNLKVVSNVNRQGIFASNVKLTMVNCLVDSNSTPGQYGAGLNSERSHINISNSTFRFNNASSGAAIFSSRDTSIVLSNIKVLHNESQMNGGGVSINRLVGTALLDSLTVIDNEISGQYGGGLYSFDSSIKIENSKFSQNKSIDRGAGMYFEGDGAQINLKDSLYVKNVHFESNSFKADGNGSLSSEQFGGGLSIRLPGYGDAFIDNSLFISNSGKSGSALYTYRGYGSWTNIKVRNSLFTKNTGQVIHSTGNASLGMKGSIVYNNEVDSELSYILLLNTSDSLRNNIVEGGLGQNSLADDNIDSDPQFKDPENNDFTLSDSSPALGNGHPTDFPEYDFLGVKRPGPNGTRSDIGPFESPLAKRKEMVYYVDNSGDDASSGSMDSPFKTPLKAIQLSFNGDTIIFNPGTYTLDYSFKDADITLASSFVFTNDRTTISKTVFTDSDIIIEGVSDEFLIKGIQFEKSQLEIVGGSPRFESVTLTGNSVDTPMVIRSLSNVKLTDMTIRNNKILSSDIKGGGLRIDDSIVRIDSSVIDSNSTFYQGGGISSQDSFVMLNNSTIGANSASNGGGYHSNGDSIIINNSIFFRNIATAAGGGIKVWYSKKLTADNSTFKDNIANGGGAIDISGSNTEILASAFNKNTASVSGGAIKITNTNVNFEADKKYFRLKNSLFEENSAYSDGSALDVELRQFGEYYISGTAFIANRTNGSGSTMYLHDEGSRYEIINNTFAGNAASQGAIRSPLVNGKIINNISWHNTDVSGTDKTTDLFYTNTAPILFLYNNFESFNSVFQLIPSPTNIQQDPLFVDLENFDYALQPGSPSIDAGHPDLNLNGISWETDIEDQDPDGSRMDMGASFFDQFETIPPTISISKLENPIRLGSGTSQIISWESSDNYRVKHTKTYLKHPDSLGFSFLDSLQGNPQSFELQIPFVISKDYLFKVKVSDPSGNQASDTLQFEVFDATMPQVSIVLPERESQVLEYDTLDVSWTLSDNHELDSTWVYFSADSLATLTAIDSFRSDILSYGLAIPKGVSSNAFVTITASDSTGNIGSAATPKFEIVDNTPPNVAWDVPVNKIAKIGTSLQLAWSYYDNVGVESVDIAYSKNESDWISIVKGIVDTYSYDWEIENDPSTNVSFRIITYDAVQLSDTATMKGFTIKESYPQIVSSSIDQLIGWKTDEIQLSFDQSLDKNTITSSNFSLSSKLGDILVPSFEYNESSNTVTLRFTNGFMSSDSVTIIVSGDIKSRYGYSLDGNGDDSPGGDFKLTFETSLIGDYNYDNSIDVLDLAVLIGSLKNKDLSNELGPVEGSEAPFFRTIADGKIDIEDVMTFVRVWNWERKSDGNPGKFWDGNQLNDEIIVNHENIKVPLVSEATFYELEIRFLDGDFKVDFQDLPASLLKYYDPDLHLLYLSSSSESDFIDIPISFSRKLGKIDMSYRMIDDDGHVIGQGRLFKVIQNVPKQFALHENHPNPFNPSTMISFDLPLASDAELAIFNILGKKVKTFELDNYPAGYHSLTWDSKDDHGDKVSAGIYFYQLKANRSVKTRKMILLK